MSDDNGEVAGQGDAVPYPLTPDTPVAPAQSAGALLKQAREAAGLHIAALAVALKVPVKKLEALESDRFDLLPDAVFVRALASSVCRTLKINPAEVLALLPQTGKPRIGYRTASINTPFRSPSDGPGPSFWTQVSRPAVLAGLLLVLGALVLVFLPAVQQQNASSPAAVESLPLASSPSSDPAMPLAPAGEMPPAAASNNQAGLLATTNPETAPASGSPAATSPAPAPSSDPSAATVALAASPAASSSAALPAISGGIIVFTARGSSWVEVTDAKGVVVLRRTLVAGESVSASGVLPLAAVVGRVDSTQVQVRGRPFDLGAVTKDNVARFEVK